MPSTLISSIIKQSELQNESLIDPVSKFRVSEPQTLIDTDFEYGLQTTKWETIELVNNIPTFFSRSGDDNIPVSAVTTTSGSSFVTVTTTSSHGLINGVPIIIYGLKSISAEGTFMVIKVLNSTQFIYRAKSSQTVTGSIFDVNATFLFPAKVYQGTQYNNDAIEYITTDNNTLSKITVKTKAPNGFALNSYFLLSNSIGKKRVYFDASLVDSTNTLVTTVTITTTNTNASGTGFTSRNINPYDWQSKKTVFFNPSNVTTGASSVINIPSHGLSNNTTVMYVAPIGDTAVGGIISYRLYNVTTVDSNNLYLSNISTTYGSGLFYRRYVGYFSENASYFQNNIPSITGTVTNISAFTDLGGTAVNTLNISFEIIGFFKPTVTGVHTFYANSDDASYIWVGNTAISGYTTGAGGNAIVKNTGLKSAKTEVSGTITLTANVYYPIRIQMGSSSNLGTGGDLTVSFAGPAGANPAKTSNGSGYYFYANPSYTISGTRIQFSSQGTNVFGQHALLKAYLVNSVSTTLDTINIAMTGSNNTDATLATNDPLVIFSGNTVTNSNNLSFGIDQAVPSINNISLTNYTKYYVRNVPTVGVSNTDIKLGTSPNGSVIDITTSQVHDVTWVIPLLTINEYDSFYAPSHGFSTNDAVVYTVTSGTGPSGITTATTYYIEKITNDYFRLKTSTVGSSIDIGTVAGTSGAVIQFVRSIINPTKDTIYVEGHEFFDFIPVRYYNNGNPSLSGLVNGNIYYVFNTSGNRFKLSTTSISPGTEVDISGGGTGYHYVESITAAIDGNYKISNVVNPYTFTLDTGFNIPYNIQIINPSQNVNLALNAFFIPFHQQESTNLVIYDSSGNTEIAGLTSGTTYYIIRLDLHHIRLATTYANSIAGTAITMSDLGTGSNHLLKFSSLNGDILNSQQTVLTNGSNTCTVTGYDFLATTRINDSIQVEVATEKIIAINAVNISNNIITSSAVHNLIDGDNVVYMTGTTGIGGLTTGNMYFVSTPANNQFYLYNTYNEAVSGDAGTRVDLTSTDITSTFIKISNDISLNISSIDVSNNFVTISAAHGLSNGDAVYYFANTPIGGLTKNTIFYISTSGLGTPTTQFYLYNNRSNALVGGGGGRIDLTGSLTGYSLFFKKGLSTIHTNTIKEIKSSTSITLTNTYSGVTSNYGKLLGVTVLFPRADGYILHRPYDGGVEIIPSTNPDSQIIRQTKKYFRYQSGKGLQVSKAVNFSAPFEVETLTRSGNIAYATTRKPHRMTNGVSIRISGVYQTVAGQTYWNGDYIVVSVPDVNIFTFTLTLIPPESIAGGFPICTVLNWTNSLMRVGMFDDQNGIFFEFDGSQLYTVRRNSTKQLPGSVSVTNNSNAIIGTNTKFTTQLAISDKIVIKGQTYKVVYILNDTTLYIQPQYRGISNTNVIVTKTIDTKVPQQEWNIDKCDGTGPTGFNLNVNKIQMIYIDYSWYGAGKVRYGFKVGQGEVRYVHRLVHNNIETEAYLRSGNLPGRYEVVTIGNPTFVPALMHWGTSIIMDGKFDDDKAYFFTAASPTLSWVGNISFGFRFTSETSTNLNRTYNFTIGGKTVSAYRVIVSEAAPNSTTIFNQILALKSGTTLSNATPLIIPTGTTTVSNAVVYAGASPNRSAYLYITNRPTTASTACDVSANATEDYPLANLPLISVRLSPSVDNGRPGYLGEREIINRMQLLLKSIGILTTHDVEISLVLNGYPFTQTFSRATQPSLSQLILHDKNDTFTGGAKIFTFRVPGGTIDSTGKRSSASTTYDLNELATLGNSIVGGDSVFPNGPEMLTISANFIDTTGVSLTAPVSITGRISWTESQA